MPSEVIIVSESRELSLQEQRTLEACEADIAKGIELQAKALQTIRDQRLYRREFATFDEYLADRVGKSRHWANRQINYIEVIRNITESGLVPIGTKMTEAAAREVFDLEPQQQVEVVKSVVDSGEKPTAKNIKQERQKIAPKTVPTPQQQVKDFFGDKQEPEPEPEQPSGSIVLDCCGNPVPEHLRSAYEASIQLNAIGRELDKLKRAVSEISDLPGGEFIGSLIPLAFKTLKDDITYCGYLSTCPRCNGQNANCELCDGNGWMPKKKKGFARPAELKLLGVEQ